jgi:hypothetical protein
MKNLTEYLFESTFKFKKIEDVQKYLDKFRDDETSWKGATDELRDIARYSREFLSELDNIEIDALDFKSFKTPAEWNTTSKKYIMDNISKMSKLTQTKFLSYINDRY